MPCPECEGGRGGWPGSLARQYEDEMVECDCEGCVGGWVTELRDRRYVHPDAYMAKAVRVRCPKCRDARARFRQAPMGRSMARVGQRLLDMLDGRCAWAPSAKPQPIECQTCGGWGRPSMQATAKLAEAMAGPRPPDPVVVDMMQPCRDCKGTGHNLRGFIPPIEWPAPLVRHMVDSSEHWRDHGHPSFMLDVPGAEAAFDAYPDIDTRINSRPHPAHARAAIDRLPAWMREEIRRRRAAAYRSIDVGLSFDGKRLTESLERVSEWFAAAPDLVQAGSREGGEP